MLLFLGDFLLFLEVLEFVGRRETLVLRFGFLFFGGGGAGLLVGLARGLANRGVGVPVALGVELLRGLEHLGVLGGQGGVLRGEELLEAAEVGELVLVAHLVELVPKAFFQFGGQAQELARLGAVVNQCLHVAPVHLLAVFGEAEQLDRVADQVTLHLLIEWRIRREAGTMVHFQQVWLALVIEHDIEAKYVEAHRVLVVINLHVLEDVVHVWLPRNQRLHYDVLHLCHQLVCVLALALLQKLQSVLE